jgi:hypothetical protein
VVHLTSDPVEFNDAFKQEVWTIAEERRSRIKLDPADLEFGYAMGRDDLERRLARLPDWYLRRQIRGSSPIRGGQNHRGVAYLEKEHEAEPLALTQPLSLGKDGAPANHEVCEFCSRHVSGPA